MVEAEDCRTGAVRPYDRGSFGDELFVPGKACATRCNFVLWALECGGYRCCRELSPGDARAFEHVLIARRQTLQIAFDHMADVVGYSESMRTQELGLIRRAHFACGGMRRRLCP